MRATLQFLIAIAGAACLTAAAQAAQWAKTYPASDAAGHSLGTGAHSVQPTTDGGYVIAGYAAVTRDPVPIPFANAWVTRLDSSGNILWQRAYAEFSGHASAVRMTADGGQVVAGSLSPYMGSVHFWVFKLDQRGDIQWQRTYGRGYAVSVQPTADGGYIAAGWSEGGALVVKLDAIGAVTWQKTYGDAELNSIQPTPEGGYVVAGKSSSAGPSLSDAFVMKLDADGNVSWQKTYGGSGHDAALALQRLLDGDYIVAGYTVSSGSQFVTPWVLKLDASGNIIWQRAYGAPGIAHSVAATGDGGYFVGGETDFPGSGGYQALVFKLDSAGNLEWQKTFHVAVPRDFVSRSVFSSADGGYVVAGSSRGIGGVDDQAWIMKLDSSGAIPGCAYLETATATWSASGAFVRNSTAVATTTNAPAVNGTATAVDTNAVSQSRCYYHSAVVTDVPTLSQWATLGLAAILAFGGAVALGRSRNASPPAGSCRSAQRSRMAARSGVR